MLGPLLAPAEAGADSIHGVVRKMHDDQNKFSTFDGSHGPGLTIESGETFSVQYARGPEC